MNFTCKFCGNHMTITSPNFHIGYEFISTEESKHGCCAIEIVVVACANSKCSELDLKTRLFTYTERAHTHQGWRFADRKNIGEWQLLPKSRAKPLPDYIPEEIRTSYEEACLIASDSPKASAAMSRRCLQGIVRDFWEIPSNKRGNLGAEINFIQDRIDSDTLNSITGVREIGDIGAHMEKAVDTIVDVHPEEADLLIGLIETLIDDWYVTRQKRRERNLALQTALRVKRESRKQSKNNLRRMERDAKNEDSDE